MTRSEEIGYCADSAKYYNDGEFDLFDAEMGWEDWMTGYCSDDDDITASEHEAILNVQAEGWNSVHPNDQITAADIRAKAAKYC